MSVYSIVRLVVAAIMVAGPLEVVKEGVYEELRDKGILTEGELVGEEMKSAKKEMLKWFGRRVKWGSIEASVLLKAFYRLTVGLEKWRRLY